MKRLFILLFCWVLFASFFWSDDEEKQLRNLHQSAEAAMKKEEFAEAKEAYGELLCRIGVHTTKKYSVEWETYIDAVMRFAEACEAIGEMQEGENALSMLLARNPPEAHIPRIKLMRARLTASRKSPEEAFKEMGDVLAQLPTNERKKEDLTFFHALRYSLNDRYDELVHKAKRYLVTGYHSEAIALYEEVLRAIQEGYYPKAALKNSLIEKKIRYRLAECYYSQAHYEQTLSLCCNQEESEDRIDREMIYLSALCYREKKEYEKALEYFQNYANSAKQEDLDHFDHALFEIGYFYYREDNIEEARSYFERLCDFHGKPSIVASLYLARIDLQEGFPENVERRLAPLSEKLTEEDPLRFEWYYLRGEAAYACSDYTSAKEFFEHSLPGNKLSGEWTLQALFHLGWCYIRLGEEEGEKKETRAALLCKAEKIFQRLLNGHRNEEAAALALGRIYLLRWVQFKDPGSLTLVDPLLLPYHTLEALLLRAEAAQGYSGKENLLKQATDDRFRSHAGYADAWYERGINHFQEGLNDPENGSLYFELAAEAFAHSFDFLEKKNPLRAAHILKLEAKADVYRNSPIASLDLLEKLLSHFNESVEEREETLYLRGLVASRLSYFSLAEESLRAVVEGNSKYRGNALFVLATLYYGQELYGRAKEAFIDYALSQPFSSLASEAWFWAAEAAEKSGDEAYTSLRAHLYKNYPHSLKAPEAYFRQYPYSAYLAGESEAVAHLRVFPDLFPRSPILVGVRYLIGLNEKKYEEAKEAFEEAIKAFPLCLVEGKVPDPTFVYFRYQAILELARLFLNHSPDSRLDTALHLLNSLVNDFSTPNHPLASLLTQNEPYPPTFEEAEYLLVQAYIKSGKKLRAQEGLSKMLAHFEKGGIREGYYLSQVWREQGEMAHQCEDFATAIDCFEIAEECGEGYLAEEEKLSLWLQQSHAYRGKREYDTAMRLLSKVINADTISPLRLQAMYFRAEVYELQGRRELAIRQLEAMVKKEGEWAMQAQEKLRLEYGL
ncbi:MAG: tetratricopeptide repeat protein [Chlamydiales bacterium]|nr:tetratricopeptide repeat protein [Chlamydiales bacterium]